MLYNKEALELDLADIERLDQAVSKLVADGAINGFQARTIYAENEALRRSYQMKLVRSVQIVDNFRRIKAARQSSPETQAKMSVTSNGRHYQGEQALKKMERDSKQEAYYNRAEQRGEVDDTVTVEEAEEKCEPTKWTKVRHTPGVESNDALQFMDAGGNWVDVTREMVRKIPLVHWVEK